MTTENNKIIEEFMNWSDTGNKGIQWDWLMEVVEKIRGIDQTAKEDFKIRLLHYQRNNKTVFDLSILEGKEYVYNACIEFIKWYNEQNKE